jgi:hypothetical protein
MARVLITTNTEDQLYVNVDLTNSEWSSLLPENVPSFKMEELRRYCDTYEDGLFPGASVYGDRNQITRIYRFPNYVEFSKIVVDEVEPIGEKLYLTSKYFERRNKGWSSKDLKKKEGEIIGYCVNGDIYSVKDVEEANHIFYNIVYKSLISSNVCIQQLKQMLNDGVSIILCGADIQVLNSLSNSLLEDE